MLKISFYNPKQKYIKETDPFKNGEIRNYVHEANQLVQSSPDMDGFTIYEKVGKCWLPYQPFNRSTTYIRRTAQ